MRKPAFRDAYLALELYDLRREDKMREARTLVGELMSVPFDEIRASARLCAPEERLSPTGRRLLGDGRVVRGARHPASGCVSRHLRRGALHVRRARGAPAEDPRGPAELPQAKTEAVIQEPSTDQGAAHGDPDASLPGPGPPRRGGRPGDRWALIARAADRSGGRRGGRGGRARVPCAGGRPRRPGDAGGSP